MPEAPGFHHQPVDKSEPKAILAIIADSDSGRFRNWPRSVWLSAAPECA